MNTKQKAADAAQADHFIDSLLPNVRDVVWQIIEVFLCQTVWWRVVSFPSNFMGQYFVAVNNTKQEFICPWCIGGGAKLWEWAANPYGALFTILLRKSDATGGGDYNAGPTRVIEAGNLTGLEITALIRKLSNEGDKFEESPESIVGRWAGDQVFLVGDYDATGMYEAARTSYRNVSKEAVEAWNAFMDIDEKQLSYNASCSCQQPD